MELLPSVMLVVLLLALEGFFSGSEMAIVNCDKIRIESLAREGSRGAARVLRMLENPGRLLGTTLIGTNLAAVTNTILVTLLLLESFGGVGTVYAVLVMSPLALFCGEILPKALFQQRADFLAPRVIFPLWYAARLFTPLLWLITVLPRALTRRRDDEGLHRWAPPRRDDLKLLLEMPKAGSDIQAEEQKMVNRLIDLSESKVHEVMIPLVEVVALPETATWDQAARVIVEKGHSRIPVFRDRIVHIVGVLHHFDLLLAKDRSAGIAALVRPAYYVPETKPVHDLLLDLKKRPDRMVVAVDEYGGATGVITLEDILEEIVGEIDDEYDRSRFFYRKIGPSSYLVDARVEIDYLNERFSLDLAEGDYETLGGFLMTRLGRIPRQGEIVRLQKLVLTVEKATARSVQTVRLDLF